MRKIVRITSSVIDRLPPCDRGADMQRLGTKVDQIKSYLQNIASKKLSHTELVDNVTVANTKIHQVSSQLLLRSVHPIIVANIMFSHWLRISTINANVREDYYQKIKLSANKSLRFNL